MIADAVTFDASNVNPELRQPPQRRRAESPQPDHDHVFADDLHRRRPYPHPRPRACWPQMKAPGLALNTAATWPGPSRPGLSPHLRSVLSHRTSGQHLRADVAHRLWVRLSWSEFQVTGLWGFGPLKAQPSMTCRRGGG